MVLEVDSVLLQFDLRKVLQNIYLKIETGKIVGLLGRNGCGKSCLLEIIYGICSPQNKSVRIDGKYIEKLYRHPNLIAYLPQNHFVPPQLKVKAALEFYDVDVQKVGAYFPFIMDWRNQRMVDMSGGNRRLIETIMVIGSRASFILLDEPFSNLMPIHVEQLKQWLLNCRKDKGILITDHYFGDVLDLSDHVYHLNSFGRSVLLSEPQVELVDLGYIKQ